MDLILDNQIRTIKNCRIMALPYLKNPSDSSKLYKAVDFYIEYIRKHRAQVLEFCEKQAQNYKEFIDVDQVLTSVKYHDNDKLTDPRLIAIQIIKVANTYIHDFKIEVTEDFESDWKRYILFNHCVKNAHHPEYWNPGKIIEGISLDAAGMPNNAIFEMIADWVSIGSFNNNTAKEWLDENLNKRWTFTDKQLDFINKVLSECEQTSDNTKTSSQHSFFDADELRAKGRKILEKNKDSNESLTSSTEAVSDTKSKRKKVIDFIIDIMNTLDPSKTNGNRYKETLSNMSDNEFHEFMTYLKDGQHQLSIIMPNLVLNPKMEDALKAADKLGIKFFHRLWLTDPATGKKYLTPNEYPVLRLPVRRQQQFIDEKISVPEHDKTIDGLTGQVTGDSRACSISHPEISILAARGLDKVAEEFISVRGGNIHKYGEFTRSAEETGAISLDALDPTSRTRTSVIAGVLLKSMLIDNNI